MTSTSRTLGAPAARPGERDKRPTARLALEHRLDRAVGAIAHPAGDVLARAPGRGWVAEEDPLHAAVGDDPAAAVESPGSSRHRRARGGELVECRPRWCARTRSAIASRIPRAFSMLVSRRSAGT